MGINELMTDEQKIHISKKFSDKGLTIGTEAPLVETNDIYGNAVNFKEILREKDFILIDFFRGAW